MGDRSEAASRTHSYEIIGGPFDGEWVAWEGPPPFKLRKALVSHDPSAYTKMRSTVDPDERPGVRCAVYKLIVWSNLQGEKLPCLVYVYEGEESV